MGNPRWVGGDLWNLLNLSNAELVRIYPQYSKDSLKGKKAYWKKKLEEGKITMPEAPKPTLLPETEPEVLPDGNPVSEIAGWYEMIARDKDGEIRTHRLYRHSAKVRPNQDLEQEFTPASPARITPSRRKPVVKPYNDIYVFSDAQVDYRRLDDGTLEPIHDERALRVSRLLCRDIQPALIVNLGDTVDLASLSRFKPDSDHFHRTLGPSFQRVHDMYAELRADNPNARIVEVDSNHNTRLRDFGLKNAPQLYGLKQAGSTEQDWPVFSYPYLANLNHVGVEWVSGYAAAEFVYGEDYNAPPIVFKHGQMVNSQGSTAAKESKANPEVHVVRGHSHSIETHHRTTRTGKYLTSVVVGALCRIDGAVPSYHSAVDDRNRVVPRQEDWQNGVLWIRDYKDGNYDFTHIPIRDGIAYFNGKIYSGDEL